MSNNILVNLTKAKDQDLMMINMLEIELFNKDAYSLTSLQNTLKQDENNILVAYYQNLLVGYVIVTKGYDFIEILKIAVVPAFQKQGIGQQILDYLLDQNPNLDILLEVSVNNQKAINFYKKNNFTEQTTRKRYYADGSDALLMIKKVQNKL